MAFTDFDFFGDQTTELHSAPPLTTNPLSASLAGTYCRRMNYAGTCGKMYFTTSSYGGAFYNTPNTKVLSLRAHLRSQSSNGAFLIGKDPSTFNSNALAGYRFGTGQSGELLFAGGNGTAIFITAPNIAPTQNWVSLRMDIFPLGALGDRIICSREVIASGSNTSSPGSGIWNNIIDGITFDTTISPISPAFSPWSNNGRCGVFMNPNTFSDIYIDNINFTTYNAP